MNNKINLDAILTTDLSPLDNESLGVIAMQLLDEQSNMIAEINTQARRDVRACRESYGERIAWVKSFVKGDNPVIIPEGTFTPEQIEEIKKAIEDAKPIGMSNKANSIVIKGDE